MMTNVVWINGPFGVGKSTALLHLVAQRPLWHPYDPEWVGAMLKANLHGIELADFQDLTAWRTLVPQVAAHVATITGKDIAAAQTVTERTYWSEIKAGMADRHLGVFHVALDCDDASLRARIEGDLADPGAREWRLGRMEAWRHARTWLNDEADLVIDTSRATVEEVVGLLILSCDQLSH